MSATPKKTKWKFVIFGTLLLGVILCAILIQSIVQNALVEVISCDFRGGYESFESSKPSEPKISLSTDVLFVSNSAEITPDALKVLDKVVENLIHMTAPVQAIRVIGHTDPIGRKDYNQSVSVRRAHAVKQYLVSKGVLADIIVTEGRNFSEPRASNMTGIGRAQNRRVGITVTTY